MSTVMQERSRRTRAEIVRSAAELFAVDGYRSVTISDIAGRAGVTAGAVYFHFSSKEQVASFLVEEQHRRARARGDAVMAKGLPAIAALNHLLATIGYSILEDPVIRAGMALSTETLLFPEVYRQPWLDWIETVTDLFARGIDEGDVRPDVDPIMLGKFFGPACSGVRLGSEILHQNADLLERFRDLCLVIIPGFASEERKDALLKEAREIFEEYMHRAESIVVV
ncbi:ScbR family autoregulator-binding transcription factor [Agromyces aerolatus]|uniref:ScbR family autoregulator-binding transcription factor n=1 Tax=Agromyces sp. LY-1074 TaxID=3074080 RepID=UPI00285BFA16|nr:MULTISPECIES: ScbR family autoregulator-binding transcription factor [unclassified Agromyces]MDR5699769.1 ScbR family autoregulator-binding transcription factor [Agromyces sp. LY-1074]MDR5706065.1 ScbR family autoregulator-binding transcription factor [Agromyces sp. LY-1358]